MGGKNILCKRQNLLENPDMNGATVHLSIITVEEGRGLDR